MTAANFEFAENLAGGIGPLAHRVDDPDFGELIVGITMAIAEMIYRGTPGSTRESANLEAAHAVETACKRDGVDLEAKLAVARFLAKKG